MNNHESRAAAPTLGKCTEELKTVVPEDVKEEFTALAVINGQRVSDYLRDLVLDHLYGRLHATRVRAGLGNGMADTGRTGGES